MNSQTIDGLLQKRIVRARRAKLLGWLLGLVLVAGVAVGVYAAVTAPHPSEAEPSLQAPDSDAPVTQEQSDSAVPPEDKSTAPDASAAHEQTAPDPKEEQPTAHGEAESSTTTGTEGSEPKPPVSNEPQPEPSATTGTEGSEPKPPVSNEPQSEPSTTTGTEGGEPTVPAPDEVQSQPMDPSAEVSGVAPHGGTGSAPEKSPKEIRHSVQMVWFGEGQPPESLTVSVMHDGALILTTELTQAGGWRFDWSDVYPASELELVGRFPDNIKAEFSVSGENITITGTCGEPTAQESGSGAEADFLSDADHLLPQTGTKEQPIMILLCLGLALIALGSADIAIRQWKCENEKG